MKLEVGKYYKSRDGRKWKCVHEFAQNTVNQESHVCVSDLDNNYSSFHRCGGLFKHRQVNADLISEWVEPVEHEVDVYFAVNSVGEIVCNKTGYLFLEEIAKVKVKVKFMEGDGL